jgi:hypothetical protein
LPFLVPQDPSSLRAEHGNSGPALRRGSGIHLRFEREKKAGDPTMWKRDEEAGRQQGFHIDRPGW